MSRPATRKQLLESIEHLQKTLVETQAAVSSEMQAHYQTKQKIRVVEEAQRKTGYEISQIQNENRRLDRILVDARARIEVYEFLARLQHGVKDGSSSDGPLRDARAVSDPSPDYDVFRVQR